MLAKDLFSDTVSPVKTTDTGSTALALMEELKVAHLPVVNCEKLLGVIADTDIFSLDNIDEPLGNQKLSLIRPYVLQTQHFYDVIRLATAEKLSLIPVTDEKGIYLGSITLTRIIAMMADMSAVSQPGGIIVLEVSDHDYSLSEIARIVESNDARVLSSYITSFPESTRLEVTIKVNRIDVSPIIQTFNRFNYVITASFSEESQLGELLAKRYESLMNYLNV